MSKLKRAKSRTVPCCVLKIACKLIVSCQINCHLHYDTLVVDTRYGFNAIVINVKKKREDDLMNLNNNPATLLSQCQVMSIHVIP